MSTAKKALKGTFFVAINSYLSLFVYFISGIFLARLLDPADFGIYRIALFFVDLFSRFKEFGLDQALIHKQDDLEKAYRAHFTLQLSLASLSLVVSLLFSPLIITNYPPVVFSFIVLISISYIFQALGSTQRISLEKNLLFNKTASVDVISLSVSSVISVVMAFRGFGALSLVAGYTLNIVISTVLFWLIRPWRTPLRHLLIFEKDQLLWFLKFGFFLFIGGLTTFVLYKYNDFILGTFLSVAALGFYSRAFNYAQIPTSLITSVISKVALPTYSALQDDKRKLSEAFAIVLKSIVRVSFPLSLVGKPKIVSSYLLIQALVSLGLAPVLTNIYEAQGAAISLSVTLAIGVFLAYLFLGKIIEIKTFSIFLPTIAICTLTMICFKFAVVGLGLNFPNPLYALVSKGLIFALFYVLFMVAIDGQSFLHDIRYILAHLRIKDVGVEQLVDGIEEETVSRQM